MIDATVAWQEKKVQRCPPAPNEIRLCLFGLCARRQGYSCYVFVVGDRRMKCCPYQSLELGQKVRGGVSRYDWA